MHAARAALALFAIAGAPPQPAPQPPLSAPETTPCGPAALAIVCTLLSIPFTNQELDALVASSDQSSFADLAAFLQSKGWHCRAVKAAPADLPQLPTLAILQLRAPLTPPDPVAPPTPHFVVFAGLASADDAYVFDAAATRSAGRIRTEALARKWTGRALLISSTPFPPETDLARTILASLVGAAAGAALGAPLLLRRIRRRPHPSP
jgi:ABC-type bacteriocin/lantibiotic exporter with double-glycine peptidase domain